jgi:glycosyltransferase involved in cell wall biosynthesis
VAPFHTCDPVALALAVVRRHEPGKRLAGTRIVFVVAGEVLGGAERNAIDLAVRFARIDGATVHILALDRRAGRARTVAAEEGISWTSVPTPWVGSRFARSLSLLRVALALRRLRPDVLLPWTNLPNVVCGLAWRLTGARLCIWNQCDVLGTKRFSQKLFRRALHATPRAVTTAFHARDWLAEEWGFPSERVHVIRSEVRLPDAYEGRAEWRARLGIGPDDLAACMLAHLHPGKDHATLLKAWRIVVDRLREEGRTTFLLLAGRLAGSADDVKALAFDLDLRERVRFLGEVADIAGLLSASDLAVFSSRSECLGRGATEPMYAGLAVAATDIPGIREAVGEPGLPFLAAPGDAPGLAEAILSLVRDPALRAQLGTTNAELIRRRQSGETTSRLYAELIATSLHPRRARTETGRAAAGAADRLTGA